MSILNRAYARDLGRCFGPIYFPGEVYNFYINAPISDPDFLNFRLDLRRMDTGAIAQAGIGVLQRVMIDVLNYNIYSQFTFPSVAFGTYQFVIVDTVSLVEKAVSNIIVVEEPEMVVNSASLIYRHEFNKFGYNYELLPDWYNKVRYPLIHEGFSIEKEVKQYRNVSNNKLRNLPPTYIDEVYKVQSYQFTEDGHKAIAAIYDHDTVFLNATYIIPKSPYTVDDNLRSVFSKGHIEVIADGSLTPPSALIAGIQQYSDEYSDEYL